MPRAQGHADGAKRETFSAPQPCPDLTRLDIFGYAGTGAISAADYDAGTPLASISSLPGRGHTLHVDVTAFVNGHLARSPPIGAVVVLTSLFGES